MRIAGEQSYEIDTHEFAKAVGAELAAMLTQTLHLSDQNPQAKWEVRIMFEANKL